MKKFVRDVMSRFPMLKSLYNFISRCRRWTQIVLPVLLERIRRPHAVFLVLTPEHGNLGDHAIVIAEIQMLSELGIKYIELTANQLKELDDYGWLGVMNRRTILLNGGGNLGTLWYAVERLQRSIIYCNPKSQIIILPNTIYYEESDWGREEWKKSIELYNNHPAVTVYARETISYNKMKDAYRDVRLVPDMVLSLNETQQASKRSGCLLCLRNDIEKTRSEAEQKQIMQQAAAIFGDRVSGTDMHTGYQIPKDQRRLELEKKYSEFRSAELVITDRLHGMIFCAITGTPCIVVDSKSPKVRGCYAWIKDLDYIRFVDNVNNIAAEYKFIPKAEHVYDNTHLQHYFDKLAEVVIQYAHN